MKVLKSRKRNYLATKYLVLYFVLLVIVLPVLGLYHIVLPNYQDVVQKSETRKKTKLSNAARAIAIPPGCELTKTDWGNGQFNGSTAVLRYYYDCTAAHITLGKAADFYRQKGFQQSEPKYRFVTTSEDYFYRVTIYGVGHNEESPDKVPFNPNLELQSLNLYTAFYYGH
jgi:hypothetical protein